MAWEATAITTAFKVAHDFKITQKLIRIFKTKHNVTIFGTSGSGKSQFINSLFDSSNLTPRTFSTESSLIEIDDTLFNIYDTPGHQDSKKFRTDQIKDIAKRKNNGIINIVSNGYIETDRDIITNNTTNGILNSSFLHNNRVDEINRLAEWMDQIDTSEVKWIITLVNKADVWWEDREAVRLYYENGKYAQSIKAFNNGVRHIVLPYCSLIKTYYNFPNNGYFGEREKLSLKGHFLSSLVNLTGKKRNK